MAVHVVFVQWTQVAPNGAITGKNASIKSRMVSSSELRIIPDPNISSSSDAPDIKTYLEREEVAGFRLGTLTNTIIVTYDT